MKIRKPWLAAYAVSFFCAGAQAMTSGVDFTNSDPVETAVETFKSASPSPAVGQASAQETDLCSQDRELDGLSFSLKLEGDKSQKSDSLKLTFHYVSCSIEERRDVDGDLIGHQAVRTFEGENEGGYYILWVEHFGSDSILQLGQKWPRGGGLAQTWLGEFPTNRIVKGPISFKTSITDVRDYRDGVDYRGRYPGFIGKATLIPLTPKKETAK